MIPKHHKPSDPIIRWAYFMEEVLPLRTSTCALFWRSVVLTPMKVLGPVLIGLFCLFFVVAVPLSFIAPSWLPKAFQPISLPPPPSRGDWVLISALIAIFVIPILASVTGLWDFLHGFCKPVEIEGGLVEKGVCPADGCTGKLIVGENGHWTCRACASYFVPTTPTVEQPS